MPLNPGDILNGRYRIISILGQGGMGFVYRATDINLNIEVAIKENIFTTQEYAEQFKREARLLAALRHPNLPRVTDYFVIDQQGQYLVMDYIEGEDLKAHIERLGRISVREAVVIGLALCDALEYLHSQQPPVIHRDIKPGNVRITPEGNIFLVDFGLAKIGGRDQRTITGAQAVTPGFSPPEQYGSSHTSPQSDIYSLGATLYTALSGEIPPDAFERALGQSDLQPLEEINPEVPPALARIIETAMALQTSERFQSAAEMREALASLNLVESQQRQLTPSLRSLSAATGPEVWRAVGFAKQEGAPSSAEASWANKPQQEGTKQPEQAKKATKAKSHKGKKGWGRVALVMVLLFAALAGWWYYAPKNFNAFLLQTWGKTAKGRWSVVAFPQQGSPTPTPTKTEVPPSSPTAIAAIASPTRPSASSTPSPTKTPSPRATKTAAATVAATSTPAPISASKASASPTPPPSATPSPTPIGGSGTLAFAAYTEEGVQIFTLNLKSQKIQQLSNHNGGACQPAWAPNRGAIAFIAPCTRNTRRYPNAQIFLLHLNSLQTEEITPPGLGDYDPAWSPDGRYIAFTSIRDGYPRLYCKDLKTLKTFPITPKDFAAFQPAWSPDGKQIAFISNKSGPYRVWLVQFNPSHPAQATPTPFSHSGSRANSHPSWTPDQQWLVYGQMSPNIPLPYIVKTPLNNPLLETSLSKSGLAMREPAVSPDGRWIAFEGWTTRRHQIYIMRLNGSSIKALTQLHQDAFDPTWKP